MFAHIIPIPTSFNTEPLTYAVRDIFIGKICVGSLVKIPYGKSEVEGIVAHIFEEKDVDDGIKPISDILNPSPLISAYEIPLILALAYKYALPIHRVLSFFLSTPLLKRIQKYNLTIEGPSKVRSQKKDHALFLGQNHIITPEDVLAHSDGKSVWVYPDDIALWKYTQTFSPQEDILVLFSDMTEVARAKSWIAVAQGKYKRIVGTRKILYYNLAHYTEICYIEDMFASEYYYYPVSIQYLDILSYMLSSDYFSLKIFTSIPKITTLARFHTFPLSYLHS